MSDLVARLAVSRSVVSDLVARLAVSRSVVSDLVARLAVSRSVVSDLVARLAVSRSVVSDLVARLTVSRSVLSVILIRLVVSKTGPQYVCCVRSLWTYADDALSLCIIMAEPSPSLIPNTGSCTTVWTHENTAHPGRTGWHCSGAAVDQPR